MPTTAERLKAINIAASKQSNELPEDMSLSEKMFYEEMRCLYLRFNLGKLHDVLPEDYRNMCPVITKEEATAQKKKYIEGVKNMQMWEDIFKTELHVVSEVHKLISPTAELKDLTKEQLLDRTVRMIGVLQGLMDADDRLPPFIAGLKGGKTE